MRTLFSLAKAGVFGHVRTGFLDQEPEVAKSFGVDKVPGIVIRGQTNRPIRYFGVPAGTSWVDTFAARPWVLVVFGLVVVGLALAAWWVLNNRLITSTITGPRTEAHWDSYIGALDVSFSAEDEALIDELVTTGHASTHGFNDPSHPVEGRVPAIG